MQICCFATAKVSCKALREVFFRMVLALPKLLILPKKQLNS